MVATQQKIAHNDDQTSDYIPVRMMEVELAQPLPLLSAFDAKKEWTYQRALCLVRLHTQPLGLVELTFDQDELSPDEYATAIWQTLNGQINAHLRQDSLPPLLPATTLTADGLPGLSVPHCVEERESFLQTAPFVSIIVSTRDHPEYIARCLPSLLTLHYPSYEIIVVDNAPSTTATADFVQRSYSAESRIKYVRENRPGLSSARNCGMKVAMGEILAFTDDDVVVDSYWLAELVKTFCSDDNVACVTSLVLPLELETQTQAWFEEFGGFNKGFTRHHFDCTSDHTGNPLYPFTAGRFGTGASMAFTSAFLHEVGGFDPALGAGTRTGGGEDLVAFFQAITRGYRLVYEPSAIVYHLHRRNYAALQKQIYNYGVAVSAFLTKIVIDNPLLLFDLIAKVPYGLFFILSSHSPKNVKKSKSYPEELSTKELKGMLYGMFAYLQSRRQLIGSGDEYYV